MKHYEIQVAANLTRWYDDIEAESEDEAREIAALRMTAEVVCEYAGGGGEWCRMGEAVEQIIEKED